MTTKRGTSLQVLSLVCALCLAGCGERPDPAATVGATHPSLDAWDAAEPQRVLVEDSIRLGLPGRDKNRSVTVRVARRPAIPGHIETTVEVFEGGSLCSRLGPIPVSEGGFASVTTAWGDTVRARVSSYDARLVRVLVDVQTDSSVAVPGSR
jgi:hypothetical protein